MILDNFFNLQSWKQAIIVFVLLGCVASAIFFLAKLTDGTNLEKSTRDSYIAGAVLLGPLQAYALLELAYQIIYRRITNVKSSRIPDTEYSKSESVNPLFGMSP